MSSSRRALLVASLLVTAACASPPAVVLVEAVRAPNGVHLRHLAVHRSALYAGSRTGDLLVYDVTNFSAGPVSRVNLATSPLFVTMVDGVLYAIGNGLTIFDLADPVRPVSLGKVLPGVRADTWVRAGNRLLGTGRQKSGMLPVIDVTAARSPALEPQWQAPSGVPVAAAVDGDRVALSLHTAGDWQVGLWTHAAGRLIAGPSVEARDDDAPYWLFFHGDWLIAAGTRSVNVFAVGKDGTFRASRRFDFPQTGGSGRAAAWFEHAGSQYLIVNGLLLRASAGDVELVASFTAAAAEVSTRVGAQWDGFPYAAAVADDRVYIPGNDGIAVYAVSTWR